MFRTNRGLLKFLLLSLITFGIYGIVVMTHISMEIDTIASPRDHKNTMNYLLVCFLLGPVTLGIYTLIWNHQLSNRIGDELKARNLGYEFVGFLREPDSDRAVCLPAQAAQEHEPDQRKL